MASALKNFDNTDFGLVITAIDKHYKDGNLKNRYVNRYTSASLKTGELRVKLYVCSDSKPAKLVVEDLVKLGFTVRHEEIIITRYGRVIKSQVFYVAPRTPGKPGGVLLTAKKAPSKAALKRKAQQRNAVAAMKLVAQPILDELKSQDESVYNKLILGAKLNGQRGYLEFENKTGKVLSDFTVRADTLELNVYGIDNDRLDSDVVHLDVYVSLPNFLTGNNMHRMVKNFLRDYRNEAKKTVAKARAQRQVIDDFINTFG